MSEHKGQTKKINKVKLDSSIEQVYWTIPSASPGGEAGLEVKTKLVGHNSDIKIDIKDKSGKTFDTVKGKISGNLFWKQIKIPEKAKEELFAEVKLSKHSLSKKSSGLHLFPLVEIKNLKWDKKEARRGDVLKLTADIKGLADGNEAEVQIWEHDEDGVHDFITKFPAKIKSNKIEAEWEYQYTEDTDDIPTHDESEKGYQWPEYFFRVLVAGKSADSELLKFKDWIEVVFNKVDGTAAKKIKVKIKSPDGSEKDYDTDDDGKIFIKDAVPGKYKIVSHEFPESEE